MKKYLVLAGALALTAVSQAQNGQLLITELNESIVATFNGSPISPAITGPKDGWTIQLPSGFSLVAGLVSQSFYLSEPESGAQYNQVSVTQPTFLTWNSDIVGTPPSGPFTTVTIIGAGTFQGQTGGSVPFDLVISDQQRAVPDTGSTALLMGIPAVVLFLMTVRRKSTI